MKTVVDLLLRDEAATFALRHTCDDCIHFSSAETCTHGYPTELHRLRIGKAAGSGVSSSIAFCKEFELA